MMPVSQTFPSKSSSKWQEYVKIIVRKNEENVGWSQTKKVVTINKLWDFRNLHLCITEHDFILARINDRDGVIFAAIKMIFAYMRQVLLFDFLFDSMLNLMKMLQ